jgi:ApaG protein
MYSKTTHGIKITVTPSYLEQQSAPEENHFVWAYTVEMENLGERTLQLINRYWNITDAMGRVQEVRGPGVVGEQPILKPGDRYEYTSGASLACPSGIMVGEYEMATEDGERVTIDVPAFSLDSPSQKVRPN